MRNAGVDQGQELVFQLLLSYFDFSRDVHQLEHSQVFIVTPMIGKLDVKELLLAIGKLSYKGIVGAELLSLCDEVDDAD